jgi:hypothetical protein
MKTYTIDEMKRAFECGRNFQLTGENNFQELIEELNQALRQPPVMGSVCDGCGSKFDAMDIQVGVCYCCQKEIKQTDLHKSLYLCKK